ncbi:MAG: nitronate monooxygenase [Proteobacteria bacterium]|nr:nitronate monooxygenase [Pseudomonadota bacterium]
MLKTEITEMFGVKHPIICGAMMWLAKPQLCAAISNAGGLGNLTAGNFLTEQEFSEALAETRKLTDKPFLVNISIHPSIRITPDHYRMYVDICAREQVAGIEISGSPLDRSLGMDSIESLKKAGVKLFQKVGAVRHAVHAEKVGYDGIYAAGWEEAGHPLDDDVTTMVLTPKVADAVKIPVVSCGGIADGRTMAAALNLGAQGVMMGTRFIATRECEVHQNCKEELVRRQEFETTLLGKSIGVQARGLKNEHAGRILAVEAEGGGLDDLLPLLSGLRMKEAWETGQVDYSVIPGGQSVGLINDIPTCRELLDTMASECEAALKRAAGLIV